MTKIRVLSLEKFINSHATLDPFPNLPITIKIGNYQLDAYSDDDFQKENIYFPTALNEAVEKRKAEYLAGRYLAKQALSHIGVENFDIHADEKCCPIWPSHVVGSISHTNKTAVCVLGLKSNIVALGIDVECWLSQQAEESIRSVVTNTEENEMLDSCGLPYNKALTLAFSAKESIFKALYPSVGYYFDFLAVKVTGVNITCQTMDLELVINLAPPYHAGRKLQTHYFLTDKLLITLVAIPAAFKI